MRQILAILLLSLVGLVLVYGSVVAGEAVSTTRLALFLRNDIGIPVTLFRIAVLSLTAFPIAYLTGYGLIHWVPALSLRIIAVVALLYTLVVALLQFYVYEPSVLGATILKIVFVVGPLALVAYRSRTISSYRGKRSVDA